MRDYGFNSAWIMDSVLEKCFRVSPAQLLAFHTFLGKGFVVILNIAYGKL